MQIGQASPFTLGDTSVRRGDHVDILHVTTFPMRVEGATSPMFVYGEPAGRVIFVRAALISVEKAAWISRESVPNDGGGVEEHDGSVSEGLASYQGHFPVDDRVF